MLYLSGPYNGDDCTYIALGRGNCHKHGFFGVQGDSHTPLALRVETKPLPLPLGEESTIAVSLQKSNNRHAGIHYLFSDYRRLSLAIDAT